MLFCLYHITNANASLGPEAKVAMLVCVIASPLKIQTLRAPAHLVFAFVLVLIFFDVCRYVPSLGVSSTTENNESQMHRRRKSKRERYVCKGPSVCFVIETNDTHWIRKRQVCGGPWSCFFCISASS